MTETITRAEQAERAVIASGLIDEQAFAEGSSLLTPEHFGTDAHRRLWGKMIELQAEGMAVDYVTVIDALGKQKGHLESVGGVAYISSLSSDGLRRTSIASHCKIVRDAARRRALIASLTTVLTAATDGPESTQECLDMAEAKLLDIAGSGLTGKVWHSISDVMPEVIEQLQAEADGRISPGLSFGVSTLDASTGLMRAGELIVIGGLPGRGKTAIASQIISANASQGAKVANFTLEMTRHQQGRRLLAGNSPVSAARIRHAERIAPHWSDLLEAAAKMREWPVWFDDSASITLHELTSRARLAIRKFGVQLVIVDYLRLVRSKGKDLREKVGNVADGLRQLAKSEQVAVVLLSQLSRPHDINERPTMISLKESGDIEAHANGIVLLYTPVANDGSPTGEDELIIAKWREGTVGRIPVVLHKSRLQFVPREENA